MDEGLSSSSGGHNHALAVALVEQRGDTILVDDRSGGFDRVKVSSYGPEDLLSEGTEDDVYGEDDPTYDGDDAWGTLASPGVGLSSGSRAEEVADVVQKRAPGGADRAKSAPSSAASMVDEGSTGSRTSGAVPAKRLFPMMSRFWHDTFLSQWEAARPSERPALKEKWSRQLERAMKQHWDNVDEKKRAEEAKKQALDGGAPKKRGRGRRGEDDEGYQKTSRKRTLEQGQSLHGLVTSLFEGKICHIFQEQRGRDADTGEHCSYLYVYCEECEMIDGSNCKFKAKYVALADGTVKEYQCGVHGIVRSQRSQAAEKRKLTIQMAKSDKSVSEQRKKLKKDGAKILPTSNAVYQETSKCRKETDTAQGGSSPSEFLEKMQERKPKADDQPHKLQYDEDNSDVAKDFAVLRCRGLVAAGKQFLARTTGPVRLVCDATHNFGLQTSGRPGGVDHPGLAC
jgi:hypothetical protein